MSRLLLVDDDIELCEMLSEYLSLENFEVVSAHDGAAGVELALNGQFDLVVLDVMLPKLNGFEVLQRIRQHSNCPILMLTARGDELDRIVGLESGADDYLPKPCNPRELVARLRAILRRSHATTVEDVASQNVITVGEIELQPAARQVRRAGTMVPLTSTEFNLLEVLMRNAGQVVSKADLSVQAMGRPLTPYDRSIDMHISKLRRQLGGSADDQPLILTVRGIGYLFAVK